jgi:hypothetical protein
MSDTATITSPFEAAVTPKPAGKPIDRKILAIGIGLLAVGFVLGQGSGGGSLPWAPKKERPFLTALARLAKLGLWVLVVEPVPDDLPDENQYTHLDTDVINHREGW